MTQISSDKLLVTLINAATRMAVTVWDRDGNIKLCNEFLARGYMADSPLDVIGKNVRDFAPEEWAAERIDIARKAIAMEQPISLLEIQAAQRLLIRFIPISYDLGNEPGTDVLITVEFVTRNGYKNIVSDAYTEHTVHAHYNNLGVLDLLSNRELEVLALMGEGLRTRDIAKRIHRSVSTIENHRENIGMKLGVKDRSILIAAANMAVLQVEDASRGRVRFPMEISPEDMLARYRKSAGV